MEDEQLGVRLGFNELQGRQIGSKPSVSSPGCLLEPVQGLVQATNQVRVSKVGETPWADSRRLSWRECHEGRHFSCRAAEWARYGRQQ
jgi:hypothetical protein